MDHSKLNPNEVEQQEVLNSTDEQEVLNSTDEQEVPNSEVGIESLFAAPSLSAVFNGANQLQMTAHLTQLSTTIANNIFVQLKAKWTEYQSKIYAAQRSDKAHDHMDDLINELYPLGNVDIEFLNGVKADELDKMIRSQQSKRSRAKSKPPTIDNFKVMMVGGVAENLLRIASGKEKSYGGGAAAGDVGFTEEELEKFGTGDPELLKKAIRNVQSKKSIMQSRDGFTKENNPRWDQLLVAESQLKAIRDQGAAQLSEEARLALESTKAAQELLADIDEENMSPEEAAQLIRSMKEMLVSR